MCHTLGSNVHVAAAIAAGASLGGSNAHPRFTVLAPVLQAGCSLFKRHLELHALCSAAAFASLKQQCDDRKRSACWTVAECVCDAWTQHSLVLHFKPGHHAWMQRERQKCGCRLRGSAEGAGCWGRWGWTSACRGSEQPPLLQPFSCSTCCCSSCQTPHLPCLSTGTQSVLLPYAAAVIIIMHDGEA